MTPEQRERAQRDIEMHLRMAEETLAAMRSAGLNEDEEVQLDFSFYARREDCASALVSHLERNECLAMRMRRVRRFPSRFLIEGKSYPTVVTWEVLSRWLPWMIVQGIVRDCEFDGFGAEIPDDHAHGKE